MVVIWLSSAVTFSIASRVWLGSRSLNSFSTDLLNGPAGRERSSTRSRFAPASSACHSPSGGASGGFRVAVIASLLLEHVIYQPHPPGINIRLHTVILLLTKPFLKHQPDRAQVIRPRDGSDPFLKLTHGVSIPDVELGVREQELRDAGGPVRCRVP